MVEAFAAEQRLQASAGTVAVGPLRSATGGGATSSCSGSGGSSMGTSSNLPASSPTTSSPQVKLGTGNLAGQGTALARYADGRGRPLTLAVATGAMTPVKQEHMGGRQQPPGISSPLASTPPTHIDGANSQLAKERDAKKTSVKNQVSFFCRELQRILAEGGAWKGGRHHPLDR